MPKVTYNALSDTTIRNSKSRPKQFKIFDGQGLYVLFHPNGSKYCRYRYIHEGKEKVMALGVYPETTLKEARKKRMNAQRLIKQGLDPVLFRKEDQAKRKQEELEKFLKNKPNDFQLKNLSMAIIAAKACNIDEKKIFKSLKKILKIFLL